MFLSWIKNRFSKHIAKKAPLCQDMEHFYIESELIRVESQFRAEIKEIWVTLNNQALKAVKLEKARSMRMPSNEEQPQVNLLLEKARRARL
jgi:hypothetical protein